MLVANLSRAAMIVNGSWLSAAADVAPIRAPAAAASESPMGGRAASSGLAVTPVAERHRSSHSATSVADRPQPRTYAESTGSSGRDGPVSAAMITSHG
jgi:hypothetical protein